MLEGLVRTRIKSSKGETNLIDRTLLRQAKNLNWADWSSSEQVKISELNGRKKSINRLSPKASISQRKLSMFVISFFLLFSLIVLGAGGVQAADITPPTIQITSPTSSPTYYAQATPFTLGGSVTDDVGVTSMTWLNDRGGSGTASPTYTWASQMIDGGSLVGYYTSTAVAVDGTIHMSYYDYGKGDLKHAWKPSGGSWNTEMIEGLGDVGQYTSIAIDSSGALHISYYDVTNLNLKHAWKPSGANWSIEAVDIIGTVGQYSSIALDSDDTIHISYYDGSSADLKHAWKQPGGFWSFEKVEGNGASTGTYTSINVDSSHTIHISYYNATSLTLSYASKPLGGSWSFGSVDYTGGQLIWSSLLVDSSGRIHISYYDGSTNYDLKYARKLPGGSWTNEQVDTTGNTGWYSSIAIDSSNVIHITYYDQSLGDLEHASRDAASTGSWTLESIESGTSEDGIYGSMAISADGTLHVGYYEKTGTSQGLRHASKSGASWAKETVEITPDIGQHSSIVTDSTGAVHIAYYDAMNKDLKYATKPSGGSWSIFTIDSSGDVGQYTSIVVNSTGAVHVSYYDVTNVDLKHAWKPYGGSWQKETVHSTGFVGQYTSIAVDSSDTLHISYYHVTNSDPWHAYKTKSGSWTTEAVETSSNVIGQYSSIAIDSVNGTHISYYDTPNTDLRYAYKPYGGSWTSEVAVTSSNNVGQYSSICVDSSMTVHISYFDATDLDLCHAYKPSGQGWTAETIDSSGTVGYYSSILRDSANTLHISYYNNSGELKHAWKASGAPSWRTQLVETQGSVGYFSDIALDSNGRLHISSFEPMGQDLWYSTGVLDGFAISGIALSSGANVITVTAFDAAGNYASDSITVTYDAVNPTIVINSPTSALNYYTSSPTVTLGGTASDTSGISLVTWNNTRGGLGSASGTTAWTISNIPLNFDKNVITVNAYDSSGRTNIDSINVYYAIQPTTPQNFVTGWGDGQVQLSWLPPASNGGSPITYYKIYRGTTSGGESYLTTVAIPTTQFVSYTDTTIQNGQIYYYYVTAGNVVVEGQPCSEQYASPSTQFENFDESLIESAPIIGYSDIVIDSNGFVHICYVSKGDVSTNYYHLKYATNATGSWTYRTIDSSANVGSDCQLVVESSGQVHIVYHNANTNQLKYVKGSGTTWGPIETIGASPPTGWGPFSAAIHLDSMNRPCVAYIDDLGNLQYTVKTGASWTAGTILASNIGNSGLSMDFDQNGYAHIIYFDGTKSRMQYITNQGGSWSSPYSPDDYTVAGDYGLGLKTDSSGAVHIIYRRQSGSEAQIFYIKRSAGGIWDTLPTLIDSRGGYYNEDPDLEIDGGGNVHVVYGWNAQYATNQGGHWTWKSLESGVGNNVRLALDQIGNPHITYYCNSEINYVHYPGPVESTLIGGAGEDQVYAVCDDTDGNIIIGGYTFSTDFPTTAGAIKSVGDATYGDGFLSKFDSSGTTLIWSTYFGGNGYDKTLGVVTDSAGNVYAVGMTTSSDLLTTSGAYSRTCAGNGNWDLFILKVSPTGSLLYSSYFGGTGSDEIGGTNGGYTYKGGNIAIDASNNILICGSTSSTDLPLKNAYQSTFRGAYDVFILKLIPAGSGDSDLIFSTFLGGTNYDYGSAVTSDASGFVYITGSTSSTGGQLHNVSQSLLEPTISRYRPRTRSHARFPPLANCYIAQ
jgi:hypothetical protein